MKDTKLNKFFIQSNAEIQCIGLSLIVNSVPRQSAIHSGRILMMNVSKCKYC